MDGWYYKKEAHLRVSKGYESFKRANDISQYFSPFVILFPIIKLTILILITCLLLSSSFLDYAFNCDPETDKIFLYVILRFLLGAGIGIWALGFTFDFLTDWKDLNRHDNYQPVYRVKLKEALQLNRVLDNFQVWSFTYNYSWNLNLLGVTIIFKDELIGGTRITNFWLLATLKYFVFINKINSKVEKHKKSVEKKKKFEEDKKAISKVTIQEIINELEKEK